jgi:hypothetical protein
MLWKLILFATLVSQKFLNATFQYTKVNRAHLTFATFVDEYRSKSNNLFTSAINKSTTRKNLLTNIKLDFHRIETFIENVNSEFLILVGIILVIVILLVLILIIVIKKFGKFCLANFCCMKKKKITIDRNDSVLSGECGCILRFRKNKNIQADSDKLAIVSPRLNDSCDKKVLAKANLTINNLFQRKKSKLPNKKSYGNFNTMKDRVKSALVLISFKGNQNEHGSFKSLRSISKENVYLIKRAFLDSDEDLNEYNEYTKKSLINIRKDLLELDQLNERLNFKV